MTRRWLLLCGAIAPVFYTAVVIIGGLATDGYNPFRDTISDLVAIGAPLKTAIGIALMAASMLGAAFGVGLYERLGSHSRLFVVASISVAMVGLLSFTIIWFPVDGALGPRATAEWIHIWLTAAVFVAICVAIGTFAFAARREAGFGGKPRRLSHRLGARRRSAFEALGSFSFAAFGFVIASGIATSVAEPTDWEAIGLVERLIVGTFLVWMFVVALALLRRSDAR